jgi:parvulin-like peptidyl-prolyl isomerase
MTTPLATVNGEPIDTATALRHSLFFNESFLKDAVTNELIRQHAAKIGLANTDAELQLAVDEVRYSRGLESADAGRQWLRENHQTLWSLQSCIDLMLLRNKMRGAIPEADVQAHYAEHKLEYEAVDLYSIRVDSESKAAELQSQIADEGANFHALAMEHSQDEDSRHMGGYLGRLSRAEMAAGVEAAVFAIRPPDVIGPIKTERGWNLFKVAKIHKPTLAESADRIRIELMQQLITKLIGEAAVTYPVLTETIDETAAKA